MGDHLVSAWAPLPLLCEGPALKQLETERLAVPASGRRKG